MKKAIKEDLSCGFCFKNHISPKFKECRDILNDLNEINNQRVVLIKEPGFFLNEYFTKLKDEIDLRRIDLKLKIDVYADKIIDEISNEKIKSFSHAYHSVRNENIDYETEILQKLLNDFNELESEKNFDKIIMSAKEFKYIFENRLNQHKEMLLNQKSYSLDFKNIDMKRIFGQLKCIDFKV